MLLYVKLFLQASVLEQPHNHHRTQEGSLLEEAKIASPHLQCLERLQRKVVQPLHLASHSQLESLGRPIRQQDKQAVCLGWLRRRHQQLPCSGNQPTNSRQTTHLDNKRQAKDSILVNQQLQLSSLVSKNAKL